MSAPLQESALLPILFLFGLVGFKGVFTKDCYANVSSRDIAAPSLSRMHRSERTAKRFRVGTGAGASE
jgi:hypothetical protein